ncbi:MAG TPA: hypothetical protein VF811_02980 [Parasulfuritortus sp.]
MGKIILRGVVLFLVLLLLASVGWTWLTLHWTYSEGERAGYVQKFSHKGWLCKTWEGELALVTMPGAIPEKFYFSVRDDDLAKRINALAGQRMVLTYQQHKFVPTSCFAETEYFVTDVHPIADNLVTPSATQPGPGAPAGAASPATPNGPSTAPAAPPR